MLSTDNVSSSCSKIDNIPSKSFPTNEEFSFSTKRDMDDDAIAS